MKKKCRRKVWALLNPVELAILGSRPTDQSILNEIRLRELSAIEAFAKGQATREEHRDLCAMTRMCEQLAKWGNGPEAIPACDAANQALEESAARHDKTGRFGLTGPGLQAVRDVFEYHDLQRQSVTRSEYEKCLNHLQNLIRSRAPIMTVLKVSA